MVEMNGGVAYQPLRYSSRTRTTSASDFLDSPGKKYPRLCLVFFAVALFCFISWLPYLTEKDRGPVTFVWPENQTRSARQLVRPDSVTTLISPIEVCSSNLSKTPPYLVVIVCSAVQNFEAREAVRESWAQDTKTLQGIKVVFLVGQLTNDTHQLQLLEESNTHGDLIQEDFLDSYANLTVKSVFLLKWFTQNCDKGGKGPQYVFKTDDDMYINLEKLWELVQGNKKPQLLMGSLICNAIPIKDPYNKWYVPKYMFNERNYPNYLSGTGYLMSRSTLASLYRTSLDMPLFHLEDIYISGILARKAGIRPQDNIGFSYIRRKLNSCLFRQTVSTHHVKHAEMLAIYQKLQSTRNTKCVPIRAKLLREYGPGRCKWPGKSGKSSKKMAVKSKH